MTNEDRPDVGPNERDSLGTAAREPNADRGLPEDLRDTWNVPEKEWNRPQGAADPFDDIDAEDVERDRLRYPDRSGI